MTHKTARKYSRASRLYDLIELPIELLAFNRLRKKIISQTSNHVLEVGVGTGKNLPYYHADVSLQAIDFSSGMLNRARTKTLPDDMSITLSEMDVQKLIFSDNMFDCTVSTFVFCTVPKPEQGLAELLRVLKPGGKALFLEHQRSRHTLINILLYMMEPIMKLLLGTSMIRSTQKNIEQAGFIIDSVESYGIDVIRLIVAYKPEDK
ncbi:MAG: class I SAM-dependent methyltransferase [Gammaproteobacteria bacterium]|nr:class I SAM-dependent methyltransferase [Gammaproteobacteria bacterium]